MNMTAGEIFDRWSILRMKVRLSDDVANEFAEASNESYNLLLDRYDYNFVPQTIVPHIADLVEANAKIWMLEADIRNGKDMPLEEVGRRALAIRDINKMRVAAKNEINRVFGDYEEVKVNHGSA